MRACMMFFIGVLAFTGTVQTLAKTDGDVKISIHSVTLFPPGGEPISCDGDTWLSCLEKAIHEFVVPSVDELLAWDGGIESVHEFVVPSVDELLAWDGGIESVHEFAVPSVNELLAWDGGIESVTFEDLKFLADEHRVFPFDSECPWCPPPTPCPPCPCPFTEYPPLPWGIEGANEFVIPWGELPRHLFEPVPPLGGAEYLFEPVLPLGGAGFADPLPWANKHWHPLRSPHPRPVFL